MRLPFEEDYQPGHARNAGEYCFICLLCLTREVYLINVSGLTDVSLLVITISLLLVQLKTFDMSSECLHGYVSSQLFHLITQLSN